MRNLTSRISLRTPPDRRPQTGNRREDKKSGREPKRAPKRSLNEAAHKLGR